MTNRILILPIAALALGAGAPPPVAHGSKITVTVTDVRNGKGLLRACLVSSESDFPECKKAAGHHATSVDAHQGQVTFAFEQVKPGNYAIALLHDEKDRKSVV